MPELPEVLTIKRQLRSENIIDNPIKAIAIKKNYNLKHSKDLFKKYVVGKRVIKIGNIAKLLYFKLDNGYYLACHLNMTGLLLLNIKDGYEKIGLTFKSGDTLNYSSVRMFGYFSVWDKEKLLEYQKKYALTPIDKNFNIKGFYEKIKDRKINIKTLLLNQQIISGIGNIYANDALFLTKIHPLQKCCELSFTQVSDLVENSKILLKEGIKNRGSSIDRYRDIYNKKGKQQNFFRIYGKKQITFERKVYDVEFSKVNGRGTYHVSELQKLKKGKEANVLI